MWGSGRRSPVTHGSRTLEVKPSYRRWDLSEETSPKEAEKPSATKPPTPSATEEPAHVALSRKVRKALCAARERLPTAADIGSERTVRGKSGDVSPILFEKAAEWIFQAEAVVIGTGAGMGVASGLATYRGRNAAQWDSLPGINVDYEVACSPQWFERDLNLAWAFWGHCAEAYRKNAPNLGYALCKKLCGACPNGGFVFTSNVDGHWLASGFASDRVYEKHGWAGRVPVSARVDVVSC
mmetsp:Transcript_95590/g.218953  ORF Transcript_95590/g.218953 Transcript_95590/m.218953 type:complete len:239 (-) Transcript_95590:1398-2114(-)